MNPSPLDTATLDELIAELVKRTSCLALAAYYFEEGDDKNNQSFGLRLHGFAHERLGLCKMLMIRAELETAAIVYPPHKADFTDDGEKE